MAGTSGDVDEIMRRARSGRNGNVTVSEGLFLKRNMDPAQDFPSLCSKLIENAGTSGLLARRNSRVARTWDISDGHGERKLKATESVGGGVLDIPANPADAPSASDIYFKSRTPEQQEKIRKLHVRTASRGARPRVDFDKFVSKPENQQAVVQETSKELTRRASRRTELRGK
mmetsp:Transcript_42272/g.67682  ORF Transcript_42272/g.67682 Transcript_42272/m.67682 type:complete len:172 (-) Transcript_42272:4042-4557(-)